MTYCTKQSPWIVFKTEIHRRGKILSRRSIRLDLIFLSQSIVDSSDSMRKVTGNEHVKLLPMRRMEREHWHQARVFQNPPLSVAAQTRKEPSLEHK